MTTTIESAATTIRAPGAEFEVDEAQLAAVSFVARYSGRTLEAYRHDLRGFFQWATDHGVAVMEASRAHIELFRAWMEDRGLAASTIDRRLKTVCGFYRFAHIDGRIHSNPAQYVRRPQVHATDARGLDRSELGTFLFTAEHDDRDHAALAVLLGLNGLRVSEAGATDIKDLGFERGHRTLRIVGKGNEPATVPLVPAPHGRSTWPSVNVTKGRSCDAVTATASTGAPRIGGSARSGNVPASVPCTPTCCEQRSSWPPSTPGSRCETSRLPPATPTPERQPSTTGDARTSTATPPTSSSPSSPAAEYGPTQRGTSVACLTSICAHVRGRLRSWVPAPSRRAGRASGHPEAPKLRAAHEPPGLSQ
ncbi:MAG TPA: site-specific integrase [Jiangellaceae bacterium]|nr:site-specific integrase [Jiangellaceae bacterium]